MYSGSEVARLRGHGLETGVTVTTAAEKARAAGLSFMMNASPAWGRLDLARWLHAAYRPATLRCPKLPSDLGGADGSWEDPSDEQVGALVESARRRVAKRLLSAGRSWVEDRLTDDMLLAGYVACVGATDGTAGYVAVDRPLLDIADRVTSLFVADFLTRPSDYDRLGICAACWTPTFSSRFGFEEHAVGCECQAPSSGVLVRGAGRGGLERGRWGRAGG